MGGDMHLSTEEEREPGLESDPSVVASPAGADEGSKRKAAPEDVAKRDGEPAKGRFMGRAAVVVWLVAALLLAYVLWVQMS